MASVLLLVAVVIVTTLSVDANAQTPCQVSDITIKSIRAGFKDSCRTRSCYSMKGIAVLHNSCREAVGVQVKFTGLDAKGNPLSTSEPWPASVQNIPPGDYEFSLDTWLDYDPAITKFTMRAIRVRRWN